MFKNTFQSPVEHISYINMYVCMEHIYTPARARDAAGAAAPAKGFGHYGAMTAFPSPLLTLDTCGTARDGSGPLGTDGGVLGGYLARGL